MLLADDFVRLTLATLFTFAPYLAIEIFTPPPNLMVPTLVIFNTVGVTSWTVPAGVIQAYFQTWGGGGGASPGAGAGGFSRVRRGVTELIRSEGGGAAGGLGNPGAGGGATGQETINGTRGDTGAQVGVAGGIAGRGGGSGTAPGGGGFTSGANNAGGGGGGYAASTLSTTPGESLEVTVGAGGAGNNPGAAGRVLIMYWVPPS